MIAGWKQILRLLISAALIFQSAGCGTLMHPERKGQRGGDLDPGIVVLDAIGLLFFIIPGVIAFAVDFSNGTIYLPPRSRRVSLERKDLRQIRFDPKRSSSADIETIMGNETGRAIKMSQAGVQVFGLKSVEEMMARFADAGHDTLAFASR
jgi:hypothetical protein